MSFKKSLTPRSGRAFTLIELSIVLVIIGLLAGGVLVGRDLIRSASYRSQIKQIQEYQTAFNTFLMKYNCIPGDCQNITSFLGTTDPAGNAINNGNGDGEIDTTTGQSYNSSSITWSAALEMWGALHQLSLSKMISFSSNTPSSILIGVGLPTLAIKPEAGLYLAASYNFDWPVVMPSRPLRSGTNALWLVACRNSGVRITNSSGGCGVFSATDLQAIDTKIDDGKPFLGKLLGFSGLVTNTDCLNINGTDSTYQTNNTVECQAAYILN